MFGVKLGLPLMNVPARVLVSSLTECFVKNVFCDIVSPVPGSILRVDLVGGVVYHSGVYVGHGFVVEVTNDDENRRIIQKISLSEFLNGPPGFPLRTGAYIYVACAQDARGNCYALGSSDIARRAENSISRSAGYYNLITNNCHCFCESCISGKPTCDCSGSILGIELKLKKKFRPKFPLFDMWRSIGDPSVFH